MSNPRISSNDDELPLTGPAATGGGIKQAVVVFGMVPDGTGSARNLARFGWMDRVGARWWPIFGAAYFMVAVKRSAGPKLVGAAWKKSPVPANAPVSIAGRAGLASAGGQKDHESH